MMLLSEKEKSQIERALGIIEGVSCGVELNLKMPLMKAVEIIKNVIEENNGSVVK